MPTPKKPQNKKLKRSDITDEMRRSVGACQHDQINYQTLEQLSNQLYKRIVSDEQQFKILAQDILLKNKQIQDFKEINEMLVDKYEDALETKEKELQDCHKNKYRFKQKHSLLESGKVKHEYFFGKKKNGKGS